LTLTSWFGSSTFSYTVGGSGTQEIYTTTEPSVVYIDGFGKSKGDGWTYISNVVSVTDATSNVYWDLGTPPTPSTVSWETPDFITPPLPTLQKEPPPLPVFILFLGAVFIIALAGWAKKGGKKKRIYI